LSDENSCPSEKDIATVAWATSFLDKSGDAETASLITQVMPMPDDPEEPLGKRE